MALLRERVEAMKAIWTQDEASYAGEYVKFERIWSWPKPAQRPHPPVLVGGNGPDGGGPGAGVRRRVVPELRPRAASWTGSPSCARARTGRSALMVMGIPADAKVLEEYAAAGFQRAVHWLPSAPRGPVERALDRFEAAVAEFHGAVAGPRRTGLA